MIKLKRIATPKADTFQKHIFMIIRDYNEIVFESSEANLKLFYEHIKKDTFEKMKIKLDASLTIARDLEFTDTTTFCQYTFKASKSDKSNKIGRYNTQRFILTEFMHNVKDKFMKELLESIFTNMVYRQDELKTEYEFWFTFTTD